MIDCYDDHIGYEGNVIAQVNNTQSSEDCQKLCQQHDKCLVWSFFAKDNDCRLQDEKNGEYERWDVNAGPKYCNGRK